MKFNLSRSKDLVSSGEVFRTLAASVGVERAMAMIDEALRMAPHTGCSLEEALDRQKDAEC